MVTMTIRRKTTTNALLFIDTASKLAGYTRAALRNLLLV